MALEQRLNLSVKLTQKLQMTPQLRQAIKILQVSRPELENMVAEQLEQNPVLEEREGASPDEEYTSRTGDVETAESEATDKPTGEETPSETSQLENVDWDDYVDRYSGDFHGSVSGGSDLDDRHAALIENSARVHDTLTDALLDELNLAAMSDEERRVGRFVILNLNTDGYLTCSREELAFMAGATLEMVGEACEIIQEFEPPGCACVDLRECLLVQLRLRGYEDDDFVVLIVRDHLKDLESCRYDKLAKAIGCETAEACEAHKIIRSLEPKPGRNYNDNETKFISPDVTVRIIDGEPTVIRNDDGIPELRVSRYYQKLLEEKLAPGDARGYLQEKVRSAVWLIKSIEQRQRTLFKVTESIVRHQRGFFLHGVSHLKPMVLKDIANEIGMHESTVSRATANKYVQIDRGIYELKYFFTSSLKSTDGSEVSSESVKQQIRQIIGEEDPRKPLSDQVISSELAKRNVDIARRTVAKYRESLGILPSSKRKRYSTEG